MNNPNHPQLCQIQTDLFNFQVSLDCFLKKGYDPGMNSPMEETMLTRLESLGGDEEKDKRSLLSKGSGRTGGPMDPVQRVWCETNLLLQQPRQRNMFSI